MKTFREELNFTAKEAIKKQKRDLMIANKTKLSDAYAGLTNQEVNIVKGALENVKRMVLEQAEKGAFSYSIKASPNSLRESVCLVALLKAEGLTAFIADGEKEIKISWE